MLPLFPLPKPSAAHPLHMPHVTHICIHDEQQPRSANPKLPEWSPWQRASDTAVDVEDEGEGDHPGLWGFKLHSHKRL